MCIKYNIELPTPGAWVVAEQQSKKDAMQEAENIPPPDTNVRTKLSSIPEKAPKHLAPLSMPPTAAAPVEDINSRIRAYRQAHNPKPVVKDGVPVIPSVPYGGYQARPVPSKAVAGQPSKVQHHRIW